MSIPNDILPEINQPPTRWVATARCITFRGYKNTEAGDYMCSRCYKAKSYNQQRYYQYHIRHYLRVGFLAEVESCLECQRPMIRELSTRACIECPTILDNFLNHLICEGETPYSRPEAVCVIVEQYHYVVGWSPYVDVSE